MDHRRIGGGLLAAVGIIAPWVAQMIGLKLGTAVGFVILALCAVAAIVGLFLLFWPRKAALPELPEPQANALVGFGDEASNNTVRIGSVKGGKDWAAGHMSGEGNSLEIGDWDKG